MSVILSENEIKSLIAERKQTDCVIDDLLREMRDKKAHKESDVTIARADGSYFKIILRQNRLNQLDFSVILGYVPKGTSQVIRLRRYNGKSHEHRNKLEDQKFYDFHIHTATERYQNVGFKEELFAETTNRYSSLRSALECLAQDCNVIFKDSNQMKLLF